MVWLGGLGLGLRARARAWIVDGGSFRLFSFGINSLFASIL